MGLCAPVLFLLLLQLLLLPGHPEQPRPCSVFRAVGVPWWLLAFLRCCGSGLLPLLLGVRKKHISLVFLCLLELCKCRMSEEVKNFIGMKLSCFCFSLPLRKFSMVL